MKKSLIALAVAGAMTAPMVAQADATLYGKFEMRVVSAKDRALEVQSDDFRIGIKGDSELNSGAKALYGFEMEYNPDGAGSFESATDTDSSETTIRKAFVGATGDFGTVLVGRISNPAEAVVAKVGNWSESASGFVYDQNPDFLGSTVAYVTPNMGGFNAYAAVIAEGGPDSDVAESAAGEGDAQVGQEDASGYLVGANYDVDALSVSAAYWSLNEEYAAGLVGSDDGGFDPATGEPADLENPSYAGISAAYNFGVVNVALAYQALESGVEGDADTTSVDTTSLLVSGKAGDVSLWANYHDYDYENEAATKQYENEFGLGAGYSLGAQASLDVEYTSADGANDQEDNNIFSVGYTVKF